VKKNPVDDDVKRHAQYNGRTNSMVPSGINGKQITTDLSFLYGIRLLAFHSRFYQFNIFKGIFTSDFDLPLFFWGEKRQNN
jgi:hypothetical protein